MVRVPLAVLSLPVLTVLAICLYLRQRRRRPGEPPDPAAGSPDSVQQSAAAPAAPSTPGSGHTQQKEPAPAVVPDHVSESVDEAPPVVAESVPVASARHSENRQERGGTGEEAVTVEKLTPVSAERKTSPSDGNKEPAAPAQQTSPSTTETPDPSPKAEVADNAAVKYSDLINATRKPEPGSNTEEENIDAKDAAPVEEVISAKTVSLTSASPGVREKEVAEQAADAGAAGDSILSQLQAAMTSSAPAGAGAAAWAEDVEPETAAAPADGEPASGDAPAAAEQPEADNNSENSSDSGKGGSSVSLEQASPSTLAESPKAADPTVYDFLIPQKLCGRLIGKNGTFVNMLKSRTGASVFIRVHPVKTAVKICSVEGTQSEIDACLELIREKFPVQKFPAMTLERLTRPQEQLLAVPPSQQLHLPQNVTCDVVVSAVVCPGQLFLQQHTHPTFRGLHRLNTLMSACYGSGETTPQLPRPVQPSSICAAPVLDGWYRAQVVAYYPDTDQVDVRFMDYGGYSRLQAAVIRQIRTDFMSLPFQAEECYLANVVPTNDEGWTVEESAVLESLITDRALEAMVVGYAEDGIPFVNLYSIQGTEVGTSAMALVNQQLAESGAARWVENQA